MVSMLYICAVIGYWIVMGTVLMDKSTNEYRILDIWAYIVVG